MLNRQTVLELQIAEEALGKCSLQTGCRCCLVRPEPEILDQEILPSIGEGLVGGEVVGRRLGCPQDSSLDGCSERGYQRRLCTQPKGRRSQCAA
jgi:hypothetical protein